MRFVQFDHEGRSGLGVELSDGGGIVDLAATDPSLPRDMKSFLEQGERTLTAARSAVDRMEHILKKEDLKLKSPITNPDKIICLGWNYKDLCEQQGIPIPTEPIIFNKFPSCIIGPGDDIISPDVSEESQAMSYVFGYAVAHDVGALDWQFGRNGGQWLIGKCMDTFCPLGPAIVMKDDIPDPHNLGLRSRINGDIKQDSSTNQLIFKTEFLISYVSRLITLKPGDIFLTGSPAGGGHLKTPPEFLKRGDTIECEIDGIGKIVNTLR